MSFIHCETKVAGCLLEKTEREDSSWEPCSGSRTVQEADQFRVPASSLEQTAFSVVPTQARGCGFARREKPLWGSKQSTREEARNRRVLDWQSGGREGIMTNGWHCSSCPVLVSRLTCAEQRRRKRGVLLPGMVHRQTAGPLVLPQSPTHRRDAEDNGLTKGAKGARPLRRRPLGCPAAYRPWARAKQHHGADCRAQVEANLTSLQLRDLWCRSSTVRSSWGKPSPIQRTTLTWTSTTHAAQRAELDEAGRGGHTA